ncbi:unnamed protein product [Phaeothamnion confervicola]
MAPDRADKDGPALWRAAGLSPLPSSLFDQEEPAPSSQKQAQRPPPSDKKPSPKPREAPWYGNYHGYYQFRNKYGASTAIQNAAAPVDPRLKFLRPSWFEGAHCLDIGSNAGELTLAIVAAFRPASMMGIDADNRLVKQARAAARRTPAKASRSAGAAALPRTVTSFLPRGVQLKRLAVATGGDGCASSATVAPQAVGGTAPPTAKRAKLPLSPAPSATITDASSSAMSDAGSAAPSEAEGTVGGPPVSVMQPPRPQPRPGQPLVFFRHEDFILQQHISHAGSSNGGKSGAGWSSSGSGGSSSGRSSSGSSGDSSSGGSSSGSSGDGHRGGSSRGGGGSSSGSNGGGGDGGSYDVVSCFSVSKWVHLTHGDAGLLLLFQRAYALLRPGGRFLLEPQQWRSYCKHRNASPAARANFGGLKLRPDDFPHVLTRDVGFASVEDLGAPKGTAPGFARHIFLCTKAVVAAPPAATAVSEDASPAAVSGSNGNAKTEAANGSASASVSVVAMATAEVAATTATATERASARANVSMRQR